MGTIWTPGGEHEPGPAQPGPGPTGPEPTAEPTPEEREAAEAMERMREELRGTPVRDIVANHAIGLWQLGAIHLGLDGSEAAPNLPEAKLAIDAMGGILESVGDELGDHAGALNDALTNLRIAYVQLSQHAGGDQPSGS